MALDISLFLLGLDADAAASTPTWLPSGALAFADFSAGHYYAGGATATLAAVFSDPTIVEAGVGMKLRAANAPANAPDIIGPLFTSMTTATGLILVEFDSTPSGAGQTGFVLTANNENDSEEMWSLNGTTDAMNVQAYTAVPFMEADSPPNSALQNAVNKAAFEYGGDTVAISVNGSTIVTATDGVITTTPTQVKAGKYRDNTGINCSVNIIKITVYAHGHAALNVLST